MKLFKLSARLSLCANMVKNGAKIADIGTDHAYLPIYMAKKGLILHAIAADLKKGPINNAKKNIVKYNAEDIVEARLSDGLKNISEVEVDSIVIAGMGGELIADIISNALWLKSGKKRLILQPMSSAENLRMFLLNENYEILDEKLVLSENKVYSVMKVEYKKSPIKTNILYPYIGKINTDVYDSNMILYIQKEISHLKNQQKGFLFNKNNQKAQKLSIVINKLNYILSKRI